MIYYRKKKQKGFKQKGLLCEKSGEAGFWGGLGGDRKRCDVDMMHSPRGRVNLGWVGLGRLGGVGPIVGLLLPRR